MKTEPLSHPIDAAPTCAIPGCDRIARKDMTVCTAHRHTGHCFHCRARMERQRGTKLFCSPRCKMASRRRFQKEGRAAAKESVAQGKLLDALVAAGWLGEATAADAQSWHMAAMSGAARFKVRRIQGEAEDNLKQVAAFLKTLQDLTHRVRYLAASAPVGVNTFSPEGKLFAIRRLDDLTAEIDKAKLALGAPAGGPPA